MTRNHCIPALERLRRVPGFEACPTAELVLLDGLVDELHVPAGRVLRRPGVLTREVFVVVSGELRATVVGAERTTPRPAELHGGAIVGVGPATTLRADHTLVVAVTEADLLVVGPLDIDRFLALPTLERLLSGGRAVLSTPSPIAPSAQIGLRGKIRTATAGR